jgi:hypothetical protein
MIDVSNTKKVSLMKEETELANLYQVGPAGNQEK